MLASITGNRRLRRGVYILMALLALVMVALSFVQLWILYTVENVSAFGSVPADQRGWPRADQRGAFILLNEGHNPTFTSDLVQLLALTNPGVVDETQGAHLRPSEIKAILIQSAALNDPSQYRVYRIGDPEEGEMKAEVQPSGKVLLLGPKTGLWKPGAYVVDIPAEGMYGGRTYFQFFVDKE